MTTELLPYIAGPGGAIVVCVLVGAAVYRMLVYMVVPLIQASIDRHLAQVDEMNARNAAEHQRIIQQLDQLPTVCRVPTDMAAR
ncbi:MAG: hypothetical protein GY872_20975 [Roseibacillus sp.]|nr:hypothetical protein [Roseibacillus sp.]